MSVALYTKDLRKTYPGKPPVEAVRGLDLEVPAGITFGLLGPNGAGKTTTVEILEGLLEPTAGQVEVLGMTWARDAAALRERIGVSLQETQLAEKLTVAETVALFGSFYKRPRDADELIELVGLQEKRDAWVVNLSGGQKQRLAVATALVGDPELLFLDEPTTGLDPQSRRQLWDVIRELRSRGRTILLTTHYMDEAERLWDLVAVVDHGKVIALGSPAELIATLGGEHVDRVRGRERRGRGEPAAGDGDAGLPLEPLSRAPVGDRRADRGGERAAHGRRAAPGDSGAARPSRPRAASHDAADDAPRQPRGRLRQPDREAPARWLGGARSRR